MKNLIYYPYFEVEDQEWLKFALLYLPKIEAIVPYEGQNEISELSRKIEGETGFINFKEPEYETGIAASIKAVNVIERIIKRPALYSEIFCTPNIYTKWQEPTNQRSTLYRGKYSSGFSEFCQEHALSREVANGISVSRSLAFLYMTLLANSIAEKEGKGVITDNTEYHRIPIIIDAPASNASTAFDFAKTVFSLKLPENLSNIPIDRVIALRKKPDYVANLSAFHDQLDKFLLSIESGADPEAFLRSLNITIKDVSDEVLKLGVGFSIIGLSAWALFKEPTLLTYLKDVAGPALSFSIDSLINVRGTKKNIEKKLQARNLLASLTIA